MDATERTANRVRGVPRPVDEAARALRRRATLAERMHWEVLRNRRLDGLRFRRQHAVGRFVLDFVCPSHRLIVEVDGSVHDEPEQRSRDASRTELLEAFGYGVLRVRNDEVLTALPTVLARMSEAAGAARS